MTNPFTRALSTKIMIGFGLLSVMLVLVSLIANSLPTDGKFMPLLIGVMQNLFVFILVAMLAARLCYGKVREPLKLNVAPRWKGIGMVVLVCVVSIPAMNWLIDWNEHITFPESLQDLYVAFKQMEDMAQAETSRLLQGNNVWMLLLTVAVVGVLTGFGEEIFFRGYLLGAFEQKKNLNIHLSVWIVGFIFSAMHCQFFGLFPRWILGVWLGYLMVWGGSLWLPVIAHALNNSIVVVIYFIAEHTDINTTAVEQIGIAPAGEFPWLAAISAVLTLALVISTAKFKG
ncbi:MAG: lysostaphin resistance A-like protein [Sodaliphilus sp.]